MPPFQKGNPGGPGGARPNSGPKPGALKKQITEAAREMSVNYRGQRVPLGIACFQVMADILVGAPNITSNAEVKETKVKNPTKAESEAEELAELQRRESDNPEVEPHPLGVFDPDQARLQLAAAEKLLNRLIGRPALSVDMNLTGGLNILAMIAQAQVKPDTIKAVSNMALGTPDGAPAQLPAKLVDVPKDGHRGRQGAKRKPSSA
jgi:hypothetical protein